MTLTNPTEDQINAAVAEFVAGLQLVGLARMWIRVGDGDHAPIPKFTRSMGAVLGLLHAMPEWELKQAAYAPMGQRICCRIWPRMTQTSGANDFATAYADTEALACCIALLRAKGVEVISTK